MPRKVTTHHSKRAEVLTPNPKKIAVTMSLVPSPYDHETFTFTVCSGGMSYARTITLPDPDYLAATARTMAEVMRQTKAAARKLNLDVV